MKMINEMKIESLVSIIVPVYKVEAYLEDCIQSIINQSYTNIEIILCDDGSTDYCGEICDYYSMSDTRIKVIHKYNGGLSSARNCALDICGGDYIFFVDSDDLIHVQTIEILLEFAERYGTDITQGMGKSFEKDIGQISYIDHECKYEIVPPKNYIEMLFERSSNEFARIVAMNKLYRANLFEKKRYCKGIIHEDEELIPRIIYQANNVCVVKESFYFYRIVQGSIMHSPFSSKKLDIIIAKRHVIDFFQSHGEFDLLRPYIVTYLFDLFTLLCCVKESNFPDKTYKIHIIKREICIYLFQGFSYAGFADKARILKNLVKSIVQK